MGSDAQLALGKPDQAEMNGPMTGLVIFYFGLLLFLISIISFAQGPKDLSFLIAALGLFFIFAGNQIYRKLKKRKLINKRQVARLFGVSKGTIDHWLREGKLPKPERKFGSRNWDYEELAALLKSK
jgi:predicted DNA-binding transcriptional regulator AlpA